MTAKAQAPHASAAPRETRGKLHAILRFAAGTTVAFVVSEAMNWNPNFLAPLLAGVLLANVPVALPWKLGVVLIAVQTAGAYAAYFLTSLLHEIPIVLFAAISLILLICFAMLARGRALMPILLLLISFSTIPIVTMMAPQQAGLLPFAFARAMAVAVLSIWLVYLLWPELSRRPPPSIQPTFAFPVAIAVTGIAIILPLMLIFLMYGVTDALPLLITTIVLVINFDPQRSAMQGVAMMVGNFFGGAVALVCGLVLQIAPSLVMLTLLSFLVASLFAARIERGGPGGAVALITFNQAMVLFGLGLASGGSGTGLWLTRMFQFAIACTFAIGMMSWLFPRLKSVAEIA